jgi:hypothetical protein
MSSNNSSSVTLVRNSNDTFSSRASTDSQTHFSLAGYGNQASLSALRANADTMVRTPTTMKSGIGGAGNYASTGLGNELRVLEFAVDGKKRSGGRGIGGSGNFRGTKRGFFSSAK